MRKLPDFIPAFKGLIFIFLVVFLQTSNAKNVTVDGFSYQLNNQPHWVVSYPIPNGEKLTDQSVKYLLNDEQLNLIDNQYAHFTHNAQQVVSEQGLENTSKISLYFSPDYQQLIIHFIRIIRDGVVIDITHNAKIQLIQQEQEVSNNIYNGVVTALIVIPDLRVNDIVEYASTIEGDNPVYGNKSFAFFSAGWTMSVAKNIIRVITDPQMPIYSKFHKLTGQFNKSVFTGYDQYLWEDEHVIAINDEEGYPSSDNPYPYIQLSQYNNWADVVAWATDLYTIEEANSKQLNDYISQLKQESKTDAQYIEKAIRFVQNEVRYFGVETGLNSHKPSIPNEVFVRRYGDCKDKTVLLNTFLSAIGVEAFPALVSTYQRGAVVDHLPSPGSFNHVISYFEFEQHQYWIDGTRTFQFGQLDAIGVGDFEKALIIQADETQLVDIKLNPAHQAKIKVNEVFQSVAYDQPVNFDLTVVFSSHEAEYIRSIIAGNNLANFSKDYYNFYSRHFPSLQSLGDMTVNDDQVLNQVTVKGTYRIGSLWDMNEDKIYTDMFGEFINTYVELPTTVSRKLPLALYHPLTVEHNVKVIFPEVIDWQFESEPLIIADSAMKYQREIAYQGKEVSVQHLYQTLSNTVSVDDVPTHIANLKKVRDALYFSVYSGNNQKKSKVRNVFRSLINKNKKVGE